MSKVLLIMCLSTVLSFLFVRPILLRRAMAKECCRWFPWIIVAVLFILIQISIVTTVSCNTWGWTNFVTDVMYLRELAGSSEVRLSMHVQLVVHINLTLKHCVVLHKILCMSCLGLEVNTIWANWVIAFSVKFNLFWIFLFRPLVYNAESNHGFSYYEEVFICSELGIFTKHVTYEPEAKLSSVT